MVFTSRAVRAPPSVGAHPSVGLGAFVEELVQVWPVSAQRVVWWHKHVVHKRVHQQSLFNHISPFWILRGEVFEIVIRYYYPIRALGKLDQVSVVVANDSPPVDFSRRRERQAALFFELVQNMLVGDGVVHLRALFPPRGNEHGDLFVTFAAKPLNT